MSRFRPPSPAMCVALLGLTVALGGTTWAATSLPAGSVGTAQLKHDAVTGGKVKNHSLTGADIDKATLGQVPQARHAASATTATTADDAKHATAADSATRAKSADAAGTVYATHVVNFGQLMPPPTPTTATTIASLPVPAGNYVLDAKLQTDTFNNSDIVGCDLVAGSDKDSSFWQGGAGHQSAIVTTTLVHAFPTAGTVALQCTTFGAASVGISQVRLTAVTVGTIAST